MNMATTKEAEAAEVRWEGKSYSLENIYEVEECARWIVENGYLRVALQFPDDHLSRAPSVLHILEEKVKISSSDVERQIALLADTSYGECCVDEVAAEHLGADSVIHYGHTCFSPSRKLPVLYVYTMLPLDIDHLLGQIAETFPAKNVALFYDVEYHWVFERSDRHLRELPARVTVCPPMRVTTESPEELENSSSIKCGRLIPKDIDINWIILYVGRKSSFVSLLTLTFAEPSHYQYNPTTIRTLSECGVNTTQVLRRRQFVVEKVKEATRIGVLVGTLAVAKYADVIDHLRRIIKESGRKAYTVLVGKPNVPKLANFPEIEAFVLVACPENSLLSFDSKEFLQPIVTPMELEVALSSNQNRTLEFCSDFREILPGGCRHKKFIPLKEVDISLVSGRTIQPPVNINNDENSPSSVQQHSLVPQVSAIRERNAGGGAEYLVEKRSWQGLERNLGDTAVSKAVEGRKGIAMGYLGEGSSTS